MSATRASGEAPPGAAPGAAGGTLPTAVIGASTTPICGVRDHATLLSQALAQRGCPCSTHWLQRRETALRPLRAQARAWSAGLAGELTAARSQAALLHYSVFAFAFRGVPLFVTPTLAAVRRARVPVVTLLHEFVYPWGRDGARGAAWAISQRARLVQVVRASDALVTTTDFQAEWLASRPWLPRRPTAVAPVFSNLPAGRESGESAAAGSGRAIGLFGYAYGEPTVALVLDALAALRARGEPVTLRLLGAPGAQSPAGALWREAARTRGVEDALSFSGTLAPQALADALAACQLLLFVDPIGPNSRKTTLAASLAAGRAVLALDGPRRWRELLDADAARVVVPAAGALAAAVGELLADGEERKRLAARGLTFARERMSVARAADTIAAQLRFVAGAGR